MTARHWLFSSRRFEEMFLETPDDKRATFLQNVENPLTSDTIYFPRRTQLSFSNMDPKYTVYCLKLTTNSKLSDFSCSFSVKINPCTGLDRHRNFQEFELHRFQDNRHMKVVSLSTLAPAAFNHQEIFPVLISVRG